MLLTEPISQTEHDLLPGWAWTTLGEITELIGGGTPSREKSEYFTGNIVWLTPTEIPKDRVSVLSSSRECITEEGLRRSSARLLPKGTVLMTSRASIGYVAIAGTEVTTNQGFASFICREGVDNFFLAYWLWANADSFEQQATGTTFKEISKAKLRPFHVPLPPLAEQRRIVAAIEEQFTQLDAGVAALRRAQANLRRYRASMLKAACEGALVPQDPSDEPASVLLDRILAERRARWEADQIAKMEAQGKTPLLDTWKAKYVAPALPNIDGLPEVPAGWTWASVGQITWSVKDGPHYSPKYANDGIPFISGGNVRPCGVDFATAKYITPELHAELSKRCKPEKGDILYTKGGTTGIARVNTYAHEFNVWVHVAVLKLATVIDPFYIQHALNSPFCYAQAQKFTHGVGNQDLGLTRMVRIVLPLPPLAEQQRIVAEVERRLSVVDEMDAVLAANLKRADRLRQAILHQAFAGKLVPQDPSDEPVSVVLERIRAEREAAAGKQHGKPRRQAQKIAPAALPGEAEQQSFLWRD